MTATLGMMVTKDDPDEEQDEEARRALLVRAETKSPRVKKTER